MGIVSVRIDDEQGLDFFGRVLKKNRSKVIRTLMDEGKKAKAVDLYRKRKVSLGLGAKLAGVTLSEFIDLLREYNVRLNITLDDVKESLRTAEQALKI
ncbi:UPF0175 family protein [Candidatus Woesearchaeota archaeon]|nr:UPF0175 family protein [Candidatus Woesearchaeota archaeon]